MIRRTPQAAPAAPTVANLPSRTALLAVAALAALAWTLVPQPASAQSLDALKGAIPGAKDAAGGSGSGLGGLAGGAIPSLGSVGTGNVTGLLGYCAKNNLLGGDAAGVKDKLMGKLGGEQKAEADPGYQEGLKGIVGGNSEKKFDLGGSMAGAKSQVTEKVCDQVLQYGKSAM